MKEKIIVGGIHMWVERPEVPVPAPVLSFRQSLGAGLREERVSSGLTLREVSESSHIALGYLSEIERGRKEASSMVLEDVCDALGVSVPDMLRRTADRMDGALVGQ